MHSEKNALCVIALLDGRPGHDKQTMGIIQALQQRISVHTIPVKVTGVSPISSLALTCRLFLPFAGISDPKIDQADLMIGSGSRTHLPMLLYKKKYAIPAITCMMPPSHLRKRFDVCFVPEHDRRSDGANIMLTAGAPNCSVNKRKHQVDCGLILLGGVDTKSHYWDSQQLVRMIEKICITEKQKSWTITSSPRTPQETVTMVERLMGTYANIQFFDYRKTPGGWIEEQYDKNSVVWVSADSVSMIYEALTAGCSVGILPVEWRRAKSKFKRNVDLLLEKKLVQSFSAWEEGEATFPPSIELNEAQRCADWILQKWRKEFSPKKIVRS
jgi:mitochondrial fission protein ELM1